MQFDIDYYTYNLDKKRLASPAYLFFNDVFGLKINLDWSNSDLELAIHQINRESESLSPNSQKKYWDWNIQVCWPYPGGTISFKSSGFTLRLLRKSILLNQADQAFNSITSSRIK